MSNEHGNAPRLKDIWLLDQEIDRLLFRARLYGWVATLSGIGMGYCLACGYVLGVAWCGLQVLGFSVGSSVSARKADELFVLSNVLASGREVIE